MWDVGIHTTDDGGGEGDLPLAARYHVTNIELKVPLLSLLLTPKKLFPP